MNIKSNDDCARYLKETTDLIIQHELQYHQTAGHDWPECFGLIVEDAHKFTGKLFATANTDERKEILYRTVTDELKYAIIEHLALAIKIRAMLDYKNSTDRQRFEEIKKALEI